MSKASAHSKNSSAFSDRPTVLDFGIGVLYFFTSHMVIRTMYYIGIGRAQHEIALFFFLLILSITLVHLFAKQALRLRQFIESVSGIPVVSAVAAAGVTLALVSILPVNNALLFYLSSVLLGLVCGWVIVIWTSSIRSDHLAAQSFFIHPPLLVAVFIYFLFRCISSFSETVAQGFLLALPLVTIFCIIWGFRRNGDSIPPKYRDTAKSLQVLIIVAAVFAFGFSVVIYWSGRDNILLSSGLNYMAFFELIAVTLIIFCSWTMNRFSQSKNVQSSRISAFFVFLIMYLPVFSIGLIMGGIGIPVDSAHALWESNIWVLVIAIFAYDIRTSLYAVKGLAVGLMFEAMCVGQMVAYFSRFSLFPFEVLIALCLGILYLAGICRQFFFSGSKEKKTVDDMELTNIRITRGDQRWSASKNSPDAAGAPLEKPSEMPSEMPSEIFSYCQKLASEYGLTRREAEIFGFIALGRSAKYIAEELMISQNTTRTHIRHVYEKLNLNSKQELLDLVLFGSEKMN